MKKIVTLILVFGVVLFPKFMNIVSKNHEFLTADHAADHIIENVISKNLYDSQNLRFKTMGSIPTCRSEFRFALCLLSSKNPEYHGLGNRVLKKYLSCQVKKPDSPYYGAWYYPEYLEFESGLEWDMFVPISVFQIFFEVGENLYPETKELLLDSIRICSKGLMRTWFLDHESTITHTNYHLLLVCDLLLSSEISNNPVGEHFAKVAFDAFIKHTLLNGIHEFNSPTYAAVDLQALYLIEKYSTDPVMRELAKNWADFILLDLFIHYYPEMKRLSGANSRSYSVFTGSGGTVKEPKRLLDGGITKEHISDVGDIAAFYYDHEIPEWLMEYVKNLPDKFSFESRWGESLWQVRKTVFDNGLVIGSSGQSYGSQDRNLVIDFRDKVHESQFVPVISLNKKPWLLPSIGGGSGHNHLRIPVFANHQGNNIIQLSHIIFNGESSKEANRLAQSFIIPENLEIETHENSFMVNDSKKQIFVKPFFLTDDKTPKIHIEKNLPFPGIIIDYEMKKFKPGSYKIDDVFSGFIIEIFDSKDNVPKLGVWNDEVDFEIKKSDYGVFCRFDDLVIDYDVKSRYPRNTPKVQFFDVMKAPGLCVDESSLWVGDTEIKLTFE